MAPYEPLGTWPRGARELVAEALEASMSAEGAWADWSAPDRRRCLRDAADALRNDRTWSDHLERYLGLRRAEVAPEFAALAEVADSFDSPSDSDARRGSGPKVVLARWTDLVGELTSRVTRPLRAGSAVVIVTDDRWPVGAETLGLALEAAGVPAGLVSIVHGVDPDTRAALLVAGGSSIGAQVPYTVDLDGGPANRSFVVQKDDDLVRAAHEVVRRAFGRSETLSGQRHGRIGRVLCHNRVFSTFSEEVLLALETTADINDPVPMVDGRALGSLRLLWELGLDEGATMIFGGEPFAGAARVPSGSSAGGASGGGKPGVAGARRSNDRRAWPTIFTNVEPGMSISRLDEPAPVLSLLRTESDAASQNIARTLG